MYRVMVNHIELKTGEVAIHEVYTSNELEEIDKYYQKLVRKMNNEYRYTVYIYNTIWGFLYVSEKGDSFKFVSEILVLDN